MTFPKPLSVGNTCAELDLVLCRLCNRASEPALVRKLFMLVSRLGDGIFWYGLMLLLPLLFGRAAIGTSIRLAIVGAIGLVLYKLIKAGTGRLRPYMVDPGIRLGDRPLDKYSFPSGHTLHATSFSIVAAASIPELFWLVVPFAALVAMSRIVLGLHYPTDVLAGALIGSSLAGLVLSF